MYVVTCTRDPRSWVSGIFRERAAADAYLDEVPANLRPLQVLVKVSPSDYPVYVIEDASGFTVHSAESLADLLSHLERVPDPEWCYFNIYRFTEDWRPRKAGTDYMGAVQHVHVLNRHLDAAIAGGLDALW